jgi:malonate decarboxylase delta subunit
VGVVASGNLEVLVERVLPGTGCRIDVATAARGFGAGVGGRARAISSSVIPRGGLRMSINDGGARPDTVALRLAQGVKTIEEDRS